MKKNVRRLSLVMVMVMVLTSIFTGCGQKEKEPQQTGSDRAQTKLDEILDRGYFTYGLEAQYRPFEYRDDSDNIVGYDIDVAAEIGRRLGVEARPVDTSWGAVIQSMYDGSFDVIIGGMTATAERYERADFSVPYMSGVSGLLVMADSGINSAKDLDGKIVGAGEGTPSVGQLEITAEAENLHYAEDIKTYDDDAAAYETMKVGRLDAYASSYVSLNEFAKENPEFKAIPFESDLWDTEYTVMAFCKEDIQLRAIFNGLLVAMKEDGTLDELQQKWFGTSFDTPNVPPVF